MTAHTYVVAEGVNEAAILWRLLPSELLERVLVSPAGSSYHARAMASTLLALEHVPLALVVDADTLEPDKVQEQKSFLREFLQRTAVDVPFIVLVAEPAIEIIFFYDSALIERFAGRPLTAVEWELAKNQPKRALDALKPAGSSQSAVERLLSLLDDADIVALRQHPLIAELIAFLTAVVQNPVSQR